MRRNKFTKRRKSKAIKVSGLTVQILEPSAVEAGISAFKKAVKESQISVSYTHLTLPTNREV